MGTYGTKNISILPVENISYATDWRGYGDIVTGTDEMSAQQVITMLRYYDATNLQSTYPTDTELANCTLTFSGAQEDYYPGTGEIIESNVIDTPGINNNAEILTTGYYYDTATNTVRTVNPNGDSSTIQYDGLGRTVKTIDAFDYLYL